MFCSNCGKEIDNKAVICIHCGCAINNRYGELPKELQRFNWGAFLFTWIWGIGNNSYIAFLIFPIGLFAIIPFVGWIFPFAFSIWLGSNGNELAWKNKQWRDAKHFNEVQELWVVWWLIINGFFILLLFLFFVCLAGMSAN